MSIYGCNMNLELQQRAVEYDSIFRKHSNLRPILFDNMPIIERTSNFDNQQPREAELISADELNSNSANNGSSTADNRLIDIFSEPQKVSNNYESKAPIDDPLKDLFGGDHLNDTVNHQNGLQHEEKITIYDKNSIKIIISLENREGNLSNLKLQAFNNSIETIKEFKFEASVLKTFQLQLSKPSSTSINSFDSITQFIQIKNLNNVSLIEFKN